MEYGIYFPHFCKARNDRKIRRLRKDMGIEGYGIFFMLLEILREQTELRYPMDDIDLLADEFGTSEENIRKVINDYGLFEVSEDNHFFSPKLIEYLEPYFKMKEQRSLAGKKSAAKRKKTDENSTTVQRPFNDRSTNKIKEKENKNKRKENVKENKIKEKTLYVFNEEEEKLPGNLTKETWQQYVNERIAMKKPLTLKAAKMALDKLRKYENTHDIEEVVQDSIISGWQGLFPNDKHLLDKSKKVTRLKTFAEIEEERQQEKLRQLEERLKKQGLI